MLYLRRLRLDISPAAPSKLLYCNDLYGFYNADK
jgi:hypothetical protein